jgi:hypothetical protein
MSLTQEQFDQWLTRLREPGQEQTRGGLYEGDARCCLGVLGEDVLGWERSNNKFDHSLIDPASGLRAYGILEYSATGTLAETLPDSAPFDAARQRVLSDMNDKGAPFAQVADFIESKGLNWVNGEEKL